MERVLVVGEKDEGKVKEVYQRVMWGWGGAGDGPLKPVPIT